MHSQSDGPSAPQTSRPGQTGPRDESAANDAVPIGRPMSDAQIKRLKIAIAVMTALLIVGIVTLIARVIYLASSRPEQAGTALPAVSGQWLAEIRLKLPAGATLKTSTLQGNRLLAQYGGPSGDGILILDLATGKPVSHVRIGD
jgi:Family of unknown function (DUF6476)